MMLGTAALLLALAPAPAAAAAREHVVAEIRSLPGATARATVTLPNRGPEPLAVHQPLPDGARIDVPARVTVVIASTDAKSTTTLRPDTSFTLISTGAGERSRIAHGSALFSVVHGALDFFQVKYGNTFTASARGTVFSFDTAGKKVTFACRRGTIDVAYAARLQIGKRGAPGPARSAEKAPAPAVRAVEVVAAGTKAVSFALDAPEYVQRFDTTAAARSAYEAQLAAAKASGDTERIAAGYNNIGTVDHTLGDYDRAIGEFDEAIRLDPNDPTAYYNRGNTYYHKGDFARAIASFDAALRLDPQYASAYTNRGAAYDETGDRDRALADYTSALRINPANAIAYYDRGNNYKTRRDYPRAIADYTEAIRLDPAPETYYNRGLASSDAGDEDRAILDYTTAIALRPGYQFAYNNRGASYEAKSDHVRALADYERAAQLDPSDTIALRNAARELDLRGLATLYGGPLDQARADFAKAASLAPADAFTALLVEVAARRVHAPSRLAEASKELDMTQWPAPIVRLFLGASTPAAMLASAQNADPVKQRAQLCNANFYAAEYALLQGAQADAVPLYRLSARDCPDEVQRGTARAALKAIGAQP